MRISDWSSDVCSSDLYVSLLRRTIKHHLGVEGRLEYNIIMEKAEEKKPYTINIPTSSNGELKNQAVPMPVNINASIQNPFVIPGLKKVNIDPQLNPKYSFDNFIEGDCNRLEIGRASSRERVCQ